MHVVLLSTLAMSTDSAFPNLPEGTSVDVVAREAPDGGAIVVPRAHRPLHRAASSLLRTLPGRVVVRLTPLDPGVLFWRATLHSPDAVASLERADLIVAGDRDTAYAAWRWARRARGTARVVRAVSGYPAGRALIEQDA